MDKIPVGILGATGAVGLKFIELLKDHPWFSVACLCASDKSAGAPYGELMKIRGKTPISVPENAADIIVRGCDENLPAKILFSALDSSVAGDVEKFYAERGHIVISNSKNHRMDKDVPLVVAEVNADHIEIMKNQKTPGKIITNPNCSTIGMVLALAPIQKKFGIEKIIVTTMQAVSGAGFASFSSLDIEDNLIPYISGEEEKMEKETLKIFGKFEEGVIKDADISLSASCNRVAVIDGHTECVSFKLRNPAAVEEIKEAIKNFNPLKDINLPSAPCPPIIIKEEEDRPQPKYDRDISGGMAVVVGRLRKCPVLDYKMTVLSHNTIRGAAGGTILLAEYLAAKGLKVRP